MGFSVRGLFFADVPGCSVVPGTILVLYVLVKCAQNVNVTLVKYLLIVCNVTCILLLAVRRRVVLLYTAAAVFDYTGIICSMYLTRYHTYAYIYDMMHNIRNTKHLYCRVALQRIHQTPCIPLATINNAYAK